MDDAAAFFKFNFPSCPDSQHPNGVKNGKKATVVSDTTDVHQLPPPKQVFPSDIEDPCASPPPMETLVLEGGFTMLKCRVSAAADVAGVGKTDLVPGKYEGGLKLWECTIDLVNAMHREIKDGQLSFRGKRVLELGCGHGLPGIFAFLKGATTVHFQDFNPEVLTSTTIPNVIANLEHDLARLKRDNGVVMAKTGQLAPDVHYYAGDWSNVYELLSVVGSEDISDRSIQEDLSQASDANLGLGDGDVNGGDPPRALGRRKSNSSRAFERALLDVHEGGYDIILMSETVYSLPSLPKLYNVIKKCLRPPYGVLYIAAKKHYFGVGGGSRQFKALADEDGVLGAHLITEFADGSSNVREIWKFFFR